MATSAEPSGWACGGGCSEKPAASWCIGCPREKGISESPFHFISDARLSGPADVVVVSEAATTPRIVDIRNLHRKYSDDGGRALRHLIGSVQNERGEFKSLKVQETYAVLCSSNQDDREPNKKILDRCSKFLVSGLDNVTARNGGKPPTILALGRAAIRALGIKASSLRAVQSLVLRDVEIGANTYNVVASISTKQVLAMPGLHNTFKADVRKVFELAAGRGPESVPLSELTKDYRIPMTVEEVKAVCKEILEYSEKDRPAENWSISVDTETNTLFPHRESLKVLCVSFAWGTGKATAIPLWHFETPYDPEEVAPYIKEVLASSKPKIFHNGKYDLKVLKRLGWACNNITWDTMLGEHGLEEDKKGQYGLKSLTRTFLPQYAHYADSLQEMLEKEQGSSQLENVRKQQKEEAEKEAEELSGKNKGKKKKREDGGFEKIPLSELLPYAAVDADMTRRIALRQLARIRAELVASNKKKDLLKRDRYRQFSVPNLCKEPNPVLSVIRDHAVPNVSVLADMELTGVRVDRPYLETLQEDLGKVIDDASEKLFHMVGSSDVKLNHAATVAKILFSTGYTDPASGELVVHPVSKEITRTKKGQLQTTEKVLRFLEKSRKCAFSEQRLIYSKASKAKNTFCSNVWDLSADDGRLHTNYNIHGTATRRLSSNDENMQNIPRILGRRPGFPGYNIKKIFIPTDESFAFVNADAKAAEVRILTAYSLDPDLTEALNNGLDIHSFTASRVIQAIRGVAGATKALADLGLSDEYPLSYEDFVNRDEITRTNPLYGGMLDWFRDSIKRVVFGILYGATARNISETIGISLGQAQDIVDMLFKAFPSIQTYMEKTFWELHSLGYVETFFGARRRFSLRGLPRYMRSRAERQAINFKIQSTSSDIVLDCLRGAKNPLERDLGGKLLLTVHDSIGFEVPQRYLSQVPDFIEEHLEGPPSRKFPWLPVAFKWDFQVGDNYGEMVPLEDYREKRQKGAYRYDRKHASEEAYSEEEIRTELASAAAG